MHHRFLIRSLALLLCLGCLLALCGALVACRKQEPNTEEAFLTFTDALGRTVSVGKQPQRVAALLGSFADVWCLAGGTLCAAADDAWDDFGLEQGDAVSLGGAHSPSLERLIAADPDLVLASASTASNVEMKDTLESMQIDVLYFDVDSFSDYLAMLKICTELTGKQDLYEQNGTRLQAQIDAVRAAYADAAISDRQRKILLLRASSATVKTKGSRGTVLGEMLADMGCINLADDRETASDNLSIEAILQDEPYHIFVVFMGSNTDAAKASLEAMIKENPAWSELEAIQNGRLHIMDKTLFNLKPNARWAEAYETLYQTLMEE